MICALTIALFFGVRNCLDQVVVNYLYVFQLISNENARKELGNVDGLTEEKVDKVVEGSLEDVKDNLIEDKGSAYFVSKATLNAYMRILAMKYSNTAINALDPGYTYTELKGNIGVLTIEEGAIGPVMVALVLEGGPSGLFFDQTKVSTF